MNFFVFIIVTAAVVYLVARVIGLVIDSFIAIGKAVGAFLLVLFLVAAAIDLDAAQFIAEELLLLLFRLVQALVIALQILGSQPEGEAGPDVVLGLG